MNPSAPDLIPDGRLSSRVKALIGVLGPTMTAQRFSLKDDFLRMLRLVWRPHLLGVMIYEVRFSPPRACLFFYVCMPDVSVLQGVLFGFSIGMNLTSAIFLGEPAPLGYGYTQDVISTIYLTPVVRPPTLPPPTLTFLPAD